VTVKFSNFKFEPKEVTITVGTTVEWIDEEGRHTIEADNGAFKSPTLTKGGRFEFKFTKPGTYPYHCGFHGDQGGKDMAGVIKVTPRGK
jgi:plastocyanin